MASREQQVSLFPGDLGVLCETEIFGQAVSGLERLRQHEDRTLWKSLDEGPLGGCVGREEVDGTAMRRRSHWDLALSRSSSPAASSSPSPLATSSSVRDRLSMWA